MTTPTVEQVRTVLAGVPDPELPAVSVLDLGIVADVRVADGMVEVDLVTTFSGCPATAMIADDVREAVRRLPGVTSAEVRWVGTFVWTPERISVGGREALREFGVSMHTGCPHCAGDRTAEDSAFGPTPCRSVRFCEDCRNPFEAMK